MGLVHPVVVRIVALALFGQILFFALVGISVAKESESYRSFIWLPRLLAVLSAFLIATILWRMVRRWFL